MRPGPPNPTIDSPAHPRENRAWALVSLRWGAGSGRKRLFSVDGADQGQGVEIGFPLCTPCDAETQAPKAQGATAPFDQLGDMGVAGHGQCKLLAHAEELDVEVPGLHTQHLRQALQLDPAMGLAVPVALRIGPSQTCQRQQCVVVGALAQVELPLSLLHLQAHMFLIQADVEMQARAWTNTRRCANHGLHGRCDLLRRKEAPGLVGKSDLVAVFQHPAALGRGAYPPALLGAVDGHFGMLALGQQVGPLQWHGSAVVPQRPEPSSRPKPMVLPTRSAKAPLWDSSSPSSRVQLRLWSCSSQVLPVQRIDACSCEASGFSSKVSEERPRPNT